MRVHVAFTPAEAVEAPTAIVVDVLRATSTIAQALAHGYRQILCCAEVDEATALRSRLGEGLLAGERRCVRIPGFDLGNSPQEFLEPLGETVVLTTTNGTRALVAAAERCELVVAASLLNLGAAVEAAREAGGDVVVVCAGVLGRFAMDDAYVAGRLVELLGGDPTDGAAAAVRLRESFAGAEAGLGASQSARNLVAAGLDGDIAWCARESVLDVVPCVTGREGTAVCVAARQAKPAARRTA
ncbi:MAG: 2-phosphosulfolactate phosphatase [Gaiellales bacterium]